MMRRIVLAASIIATSLSAASAQEDLPAYLDNRSDPASLIKSYYNAINRKEYARAWSYYGEKKPSESLDAFAKGFSDTRNVTVIAGNASEEGAAGSVFYSIPVAISASASDGSEKVYAGCYTMRLSNPQIQADVFAPMDIESGTLAPSGDTVEASLPERCGDGQPSQPVDRVVEEARRLFVANHATDCSAIRTDGHADAPEDYKIAYRSGSTADETESITRLMRFYCGSGAYNESHVYYLHTAGEAVRELQFATPELDIRYAAEDSDEKVESIGIIGYTAHAELVNSVYDEASKTITSAAKWRGVGDASSSGTWMFRDGEFTLVKYDVDASYNGEIDPETIIDFHTGP